MSFLLWEPLIYTIHHMAHWISKWRCGRRIAGHHLRHHAQHTERHAYTDTKVYRQAAEIAGLGVLSWVLDNQDTCLELIRTALVYKIAHTLQHVLPPEAPIRQHHEQHHKSPQKNLGISSPLLDVLLGRLHPGQRVARDWRALLLPLPVLGFWALERTD